MYTHLTIFITYRSEVTLITTRFIFFITEVDGNGDKIDLNGGAYKHTPPPPPPPPPYRMPPQPLYGEPASIPGSATPSVQQMHTHSNKFPVSQTAIVISLSLSLSLSSVSGFCMMYVKQADRIRVEHRFSWSQARRSEGQRMKHFKIEFNRDYILTTNVADWTRSNIK